MAELMRASQEAVDEAASIGAGLSANDVDLDQLMQELSLFT